MCRRWPCSYCQVKLHTYIRVWFSINCSCNFLCFISTFKFFLSLESMAYHHPIPLAALTPRVSTNIFLISGRSFPLERTRDGWGAVTKSQILTVTPHKLQSKIVVERLCWDLDVEMFFFVISLYSGCTDLENNNMLGPSSHVGWNWPWPGPTKHAFLAD